VPEDDLGGIYVRYRASLIAGAVRRGLPEAAAEDALHDAVLAFLERPPGLDQPLRWLRARVRFGILTYYAHARRRGAEEDEDSEDRELPDPRPTPDHAACIKDLSTTIGCALGVLEPRQRAILWRYGETRSLVGVASEFGVRKDTVRKLVTSAGKAIVAAGAV